MNDIIIFTKRKSSLSFGEGWGEVCYSFDAWGNRRNTSDWTAAETNTVTNNHLFSRGFTGHEHLDAFGLINMNGRCYDPLLGRILSPDPELQDPANVQNYNRYSYCLNNPLKYTDPSGYYIYGKTYQADPVYSMPHFNDLDLPDGCRSDIAEYIDELQNKFEMERLDIMSRFGLVGGLGGGGGDSGYSNKPGSSADNADDCKPDDGIDPKVNAIGHTETIKTEILPGVYFTTYTNIINSVPGTLEGIVYDPTSDNAKIGINYDFTNMNSTLKLMPSINSVTITDRITVGIGIFNLGTNLNNYSAGVEVPTGSHSTWGADITFNNYAAANAVFIIGIGIVCPIETVWGAVLQLVK